MDDYAREGRHEALHGLTMTLNHQHMLDYVSYLSHEYVFVVSRNLLRQVAIVNDEINVKYSSN